MTDTVKCLGKVQGIDDDIRIGVQECHDNMEKMNQGCSGRANRPSHMITGPQK
jgi:hypothetical protein